MAGDEGGTQPDDDFNQRPLCAAHAGGYGRARARGRLRTLKEIAARQEISEKYLESIVKLLVQNNVLIGVRGKGGGYRLNGTPDQFTVRRILEITEGSLAPVACLCEPHEPCARMANCRTYPMWQGLSKLICDYLDSYTLADLMKSDDAGFDYII